jgi:predicted PurR-regulated permease PerM
MKVKIEIDTQTFVRFWLVVAGFGLAALAIYSARTALVLVVISFFLALALNAPVHHIAKYLPGNSRLAGTAVAYVAVVGIVLGFGFLVVPPMVQQTIHFAETIPGLIDENKGNFSSFEHLVDKYQLQPQIDKAIANAKDSASEWAASIGSNALNGLNSILGGLISLVLVLVTSFLMLLEGPTWMRRYWQVYQDQAKREHHEQLVLKMKNVMTGYVNGQLAVAAIAGVLSGVTVFILSFIFADVSANLALPVVAIASILSLVPMFGATIAGILITLMLALNSVPAAIVFAVYFIVYQQIENNFISPVIQSKTVQLSALVVLVSVTIGTYMFGLAGGIVSIPIAGWIKVLAEDYFQNRQPALDKSEKPVAKLVRKIRSNNKTVKSA